MTRENGAVSVEAPVPVLGRVRGTKTLKEMIDGAPSAAQQDDTPAVVARELGEPRVSAAQPPPETSGGGSTGGTSTGGTSTGGTGTGESGSGSPTAVAPAPTPTKTSPTKDDPETAANKLLQLAESYIGSGAAALGAKKLRQIVEKYPDTQAAAKAKVLLTKL